MKKAYRDAFTEEHVKTAVPQQIRTMRLKRNLTQTDLATLAKTTQPVIARVEDTNYGNLSLNTLLKIASALDVGLLVKFVPYSRLVREFEDMSNTALIADEYSKDLPVLQRWSKEQPTTDQQLEHLVQKRLQPHQANESNAMGALAALTRHRTPSPFFQKDHEESTSAMSALK